MTHRTPNTSASPIVTLPTGRTLDAWEIEAIGGADAARKLIRALTLEIRAAGFRGAQLADMVADAVGVEAECAADWKWHQIADTWNVLEGG
jgi:hypothetical protein